MVIQACNPSIWEAKAEGLGVQGHLSLCREFKASLGLCLKTNKHTNKQNEKNKKKKTPNKKKLDCF